MIVVGTWALLRDSVNLALDAVPGGIDRAGVETYLASLPGVAEVHDLHIWAMSTTETALTAHLVRPGADADDGLLAQACRELPHRFGIGHATLQIESGDRPIPARWRRRRWSSRFDRFRRFFGVRAGRRAKRPAAPAFFRAHPADKRSKTD